jgi:ABC-type branched-subunit amino acid transport system permease subunit
MLEYLVSVLTLGCATAIIVLGLNVRWGLSGQLDLGYYLMVAVGAYVTGVFALPPSSSQADPTLQYILGLRWPFLVAIPIAGLTCAVLSLFLGIVALRKLRDNSYAIVTVAATIIGYSFIAQFTPLFDGYNGLYAVPRPLFGLLGLGPGGYADFYLFLSALVLVVVYLLMELVRRSPFGRAVRAAREDEVASAAFGRSVYRLRLKSYVLGGAVGGIGGSLLMGYITAFNPASWSAIETFLLYGALIVGGTGNNLGAVLGTFIVLVGIPQLAQALPAFGNDATVLPAIENMVIGLLIIVALRFRPAGILPELQTMQSQFRGRRLLGRLRRPGRATEAAPSDDQ